MNITPKLDSDLVGAVDAMIALVTNDSMVDRAHALNELAFYISTADKVSKTRNKVYAFMMNFIADIELTPEEQYDGRCEQWIDFVESLRKQKPLTQTETEETVLDLSSQVTAEDECIDLAKHLSAVLKDEKTPTALYNAIVDGLSEFNLPTDYVDSPEYIAKILCQEDSSG